MNYSKLIEDDRLYRNNELSFLKNIILSYKNKEGGETLIRSGILLLYAHWEGFCKESSKKYIKYIQNSKIPIEKISKDILINNIFNSINGKIRAWTFKKIFGSAVTTQDLIINIDTENNLKYSTMKNKILSKIWIDQKEIEKVFWTNLLQTSFSQLSFVKRNKLQKYYILKDNQLEEKNFDSYDNLFLHTTTILLHYRNQIWHGVAQLCLSIEEFLFIFELIRTLILSYKDVLVDHIK